MMRVSGSHPLHPLTWLLGWAAFAVGLQWLTSLPALLAIAAFASLVAACCARRRMRLLLWRARWLFLSLAILFLLFTPGEYLAGAPEWLGLTREGVERASDQIARLLTMLVALAVLHERIGTRGLLAAFHTLLRPFSIRDATVIRLLLVLEYAEAKQPAGWREWLLPSGASGDGVSDRLTLVMTPLQARDVLLILVWIVTAGAWIVAA